jgi:YopX protein
MRLRYKVWDKSKGKMYHWGADFGYVTDHGIVLLNSGGMILPLNVETLLYSTLLDDNEKEMCEGDLVKCGIGHLGDYLCKIVWNNGGLFFEPVVPSVQEGLDVWEHSQRFVIWEHIVHPIIIGNIYEDPGLMASP